VINKGNIEVLGGNGEVHRAGPLDCVFVPAGIPHGVKNAGVEDVEMIWLHDRIESNGAPKYYDDDSNMVQTDPIKVIKFNDLDPYWGSVRAKEPGWLRWLISWVGGSENFVNFNRDHAALSDQVGLGLIVLLPGNNQCPHSHPDAEVYVILCDKALIYRGHGNEELETLDSVYIPPETTHGL